MRRLTIGFDAKRAIRNNTGLGNYSRLIIDSMATRCPENQHILYTPDMRDNPRMKPILEHKNVELRLPTSRMDKAFPSLWRISGITTGLKRDGIDLYHGLSNELPLNIGRSGIPSVVTIHDIIFRHHPECYKPIDRLIYNYKFAKAAREATRVIAISECTRRDIIREYGISPNKIDVIYQGCDKQFSREVSDNEIVALRKKYDIDGPYIVSIGTVERRKNQLLAVMALKGLPKEISLVIVGRQTKYANEIKQYISRQHLESRVKWVEGAPFNELPVFYRGAIFSTYTSRYEGFGLPVIEALSASTPVVIARGSCLEEAGGKDTPAVNPDDVDSLIAIGNSLIEDDEYRTHVAIQGNKHVQRFSHEAFVNGTLDTYLKAIDQYS